MVVVERYQFAVEKLPVGPVVELAGQQVFILIKIKVIVTESTIIAIIPEHDVGYCLLGFPQ